MLTADEVLKIARLARLELSTEEVTAFQKKLGGVLDYIAELNQVQTPKDAFVRHVPMDAAGMRPDEIRRFESADALLKNAPHCEESHFVLPAIMEQE